MSAAVSGSRVTRSHVLRAGAGWLAGGVLAACAPEPAGQGPAASKGVIQEITPTLKALKFDVNSIYDVENITHWQGKRHGLLIQLNVIVWVYNRNAFQSAGIKEPTADWTRQDHLDSAKRLHKPQDNRWGTFMRHSYPYEWYWSADVPYMDAKGTETYWDRPASREILQWLADMVLRYQIAPSPQEITDKRLTFEAGNYAISTYTNLNPAAVTTAVAGKFEWDVAPRARHPRTKKAISQATGHNYLATTRAKQRGVMTEAMQVLTSLFDKEIQDLYNSGLSVSSLPVLKSVAAQAGNLPGAPKNYKLALDVISQGRNFDKVIGFLDFHNAFGPEFAKALNGQVTLEQAAVNMARVSDAALKNAAR